MVRSFVGSGSRIALLLVIAVGGVMAQTRPRPAAQKPASQKTAASKPAANDLKITYKVSTAGQTMESTTMLKGKRERSETRNAYLDSVNITQCDSKRSIQINNKSQKYLVSAMGTGDGSQPVSTTSTTTSTPAQAGGLVTYTTSATDTGERKKMFGFTARHVKTSLKIESSPDACSPMQQRMETDGWYIDLTYGLECDVTHVQTASTSAAQGGCQDRTQFKRLGAARTGYALMETTTMYGPDGKVIFSSSKEVVELSREPLDAALFDVPAGYTEVRDSQELYAMAATSSSMGQTNATQPAANASYGNQAPNAQSKRPGIMRVGVVAIGNRAGKPVAMDSLRERLLAGIMSSDVEAIQLNAISQSEAEVEAKTKQCDFILYSDLTGLKSSTAKKIGGMFGRAVGGSGIDKTEAKVDFRLFAVGETSPRLQASATAKEEGDEQSAGTAIDSEARQVSAAVRRK